MRWYDYAFCVYCADLITAGIFGSSIFYLTWGVLWYIMYSKIREQGAL